MTDLEVGSGLSDGDVVGRGWDVDEARVFPGRVLGRVIDVIAGNQKPEGEIIIIKCIHKRMPPS